MVVLTTQQMVKMTAIDGAWTSEVRTRKGYVFPAKYEYLRPLFESEQYQSYWSTGFNFLSPDVGDIDFGYEYQMSQNTFFNKIKETFAAFKYYWYLNGLAYKHSYMLARYNMEVHIPTTEELQAAWYEEYDALDRQQFAELSYY